MKKSVIITGHAGGIGKALVSEFKGAGYFTIGLDGECSVLADVNIVCDLAELVNDNQKLTTVCDQINVALEGKGLNVLVNNAAVQILDGINRVSLDDFKFTLDVNLVAPFLLSKLMFSRLKESKGAILNIGSIHSLLTKPRFISYATSKAALKGMTQAMAVDFGRHVRVNMIQPAAISTEMLVDGFKNNPDGLSQLASYHPSGSIGAAEEVARLAVFLSSDDVRFINGASVDMSGAIGARLHDPS